MLAWEHFDTPSRPRTVEMDMWRLLRNTSIRSSGSDKGKMKNKTLVGMLAQDCIASCKEGAGRGFLPPSFFLHPSLTPPLLPLNQIFQMCGLVCACGFWHVCCGRGLKQLTLHSATRFQHL